MTSFQVTNPTDGTLSRYSSIKKQESIRFVGFVKKLRSFLLFCLDYSGCARWPKLYESSPNSLM